MFIWANDQAFTLVQSDK